MDCSLPDSSVPGILQARLLEWVAISFSRRYSQPRDQTHVSCIGRQILYHWATWESIHPPLCQSPLVLQNLFCYNLSEMVEYLVLILRSNQFSWVAEMIKNSTAMQESWVLACIRKIPCRKKWLSTPVFLRGEFRDSRAWCVRSMGWQRVEYDSMTKHTHIYKYVCV